MEEGLTWTQCLPHRMPLTPEKVQRAREHVAAIHDRIRRRGVDLSRLPDPVEELIKARDAGYREP